jgi:hypothetical protein
MSGEGKAKAKEGDKIENKFVPFFASFFVLL